MNFRSHVLFWSLVFAAFLAVVFLFQSILMPFVVGIAVAYLLNPTLHKIEKAGFSRNISAPVILALFLAFVIALIAVMAPLVVRESREITENFPSYLERFFDFAQPYINQAQWWLGHQNSTDIKSLLANNSGKALDAGNVIIGGIAASGQALRSLAGSLVMLAVVAPLVAYFMMKEWPSILKWGEGLLPRQHKETIKDLLYRINTKIAGFVRGQVTVALVLGFGYALALSLLGLKYGFLIGLGAGLISIIPMVGSTVGLFVSAGVAWLQSGDWIFLAQVIGVFLVGQLIEGNFLTPKLVGKSVGMHPLWVFFAVLAGGSLFGILGMLLAVPVAAAVGVLVAFAIAQYKDSDFYKGRSSSDDKKPARSAKSKSGKRAR